MFKDNKITEERVDGNVILFCQILVELQPYVAYRYTNLAKINIVFCEKHLGIWNL